MAETNIENATLKLLIEDEDGIVTVASLQQTPAPSGDGIGGSIADGQIAFGNGTEIAGNAQFSFDQSGNFFSIFLGSLELDWDDDASEATLNSNGNSTIIKGASISLGNGQTAFASAGNIRLQKVCSIKARNNAGDGDIAVLGVSGNVVTLGSDADYVALAAGGIGVGTTGDINLNPTGAVNIGTLLALTPIADPDPLQEGMVWAGTDHHLYYYNGTTKKQLDN